MLKILLTAETMGQKHVLVVAILSLSSFGVHLELLGFSAIVIIVNQGYHKRTSRLAKEAQRTFKWERAPLV